MKKNIFTVIIYFVSVTKNAYMEQYIGTTEKIIKRAEAGSA
jgi:hypothetical protein